MGGIKLEYFNEHVILYKNETSKYYQIRTIKDWIFLTKFFKAYLITNYPNGEIETIVDRKFVYNQDFELVADLNFEYKFILPLGNLQPKADSYPNDNICPFTGSLEGNGHVIKNINIIDCDNNGLFGIVKTGDIKNLTLENINISRGIYNGCLFGKAYDSDIENINIYGNINLHGVHCSGLSSSYEGTCKNIKICVDGEINAQYKSIISNYFFGQMENINVIQNISDDISCFNVINGILKNSNIISFNTLKNPFYEKTTYHQIFNCYYFQINDDDLPPMQNIQQSYYRNLSNRIISPDNITSSTWLKINNGYYLKNMINYIGEEIDIRNIPDNFYYYDIINNTTNYSELYLDKNKKFVGKDIKSFNKNEIIELCKKMEIQFYKEKEKYRKFNEIKHKNDKIKIKQILSLFDNSNSLEIINDDSEIEDINYLYESDSMSESSIEESYSNQNINKQKLADEIIMESAIIDTDLIMGQINISASN
jgi:hypothetical protein